MLSVSITSGSWRFVCATSGMDVLIAKPQENHNAMCLRAHARHCKSDCVKPVNLEALRSEATKQSRKH